MKTKEKKIEKRYSLQQKLMNIFVMVLFGGVFTWMGLSVYRDAKSEKGSDPYYASLPNTSDTISNEKVCMADDIYQGEYPTIAAPILSKTYYACDQKGIQDLHANAKIRMASDPITKKQVDKASAIIAIDPRRDGKVLYFESVNTHAQYVQISKTTSSQNKP